jgi:hypothetical protein
VSIPEQGLSMPEYPEHNNIGPILASYMQNRHLLLVKKLHRQRPATQRMSPRIRRIGPIIQRSSPVAYKDRVYLQLYTNQLHATQLHAIQLCTTGVYLQLHTTLTSTAYNDKVESTLGVLGQ